MKIILVVAKSKNNVIGQHNQLPWHLPADLAHFKKITLGKPIVMGRKTFDSIGKALPGRRNIIISRNKNFSAAGCDVFHSVAEALSALKNEKEIMIIGGANLYQQFLDRAQGIYMTVIDAEFEGDTFFPALNLQHWHLVSAQKYLPDAKNQYAYEFQEWTNSQSFV